MMIRHSGRAVLAFTIMALSVSMTGEAQEAAASASSPHSVRTTKFTIGDVDPNTAFYVEMLGMSEVNRFVAEGRLVEPFMGFGDPGQRIGLLSYTKKEAIEKSPYPVSVIYTGEFDELVKRFEAAQYPLLLLPTSDTGGVRIAIATDPSGNAIEVIDRPGEPGVAGSRLIVDDRQKAEEFFLRVFGSGVKPGQRFETDAFDEVLLDFGEGMFVALFEPKGVAPLEKSDHPVVAIYTTEFDAVIERVKAEGHGYLEWRPHVYFADDPSGNVVEIVRQRD
jgi:catechol 2,3-dioxygenase-like lactoylglutathione lyase family enzyme